MNPQDKAFLAKTALILFILGLTIPFIIAIFASDEIAMEFGVVSEVLALVLGILSWRHFFGKVTTIGVGILMALSVVNYVAFQNKRANAETEMQRAFEARKAKAEQDAGEATGD